MLRRLRSRSSARDSAGEGWETVDVVAGNCKWGVLSGVDVGCVSESGWMVSGVWGCWCWSSACPPSRFMCGVGWAGAGIGVPGPNGWAGRWEDGARLPSPLSARRWVGYSWSHSVENVCVADAASRTLSVVPPSGGGGTGRRE